MSTCQNCSARTDTYLCGTCVKRIRQWLEGTPELGGVPEIMAQLEIVATRQHRYRGPYQDGSKPKVVAHPLPHHIRAADAASRLAKTLTDTATRVASVENTVPVLAGVARLHLTPHPRDRVAVPDVSVAVPYAEPVPAAVSACRWLLEHLNGLARTEWAGECFRALERAVEQAEAACVPDPPEWFAGQCDCETGLYAEVDRQGHPVVKDITCEGCGKTHPIEGLREKMMAQAEGLNVTSVTALSWVQVFLSVTVPRNTWDSWVFRGRILARGKDEFGHPTYRFGDVCDRVTVWMGERERKRHRLMRHEVDN